MPGRSRRRDAFGVLKSNALVRSPTTARRHGVMLDSIRSGRCWREPGLEEADQRRVVEQLRVDPAARVHGETTIIGTRMPSPYGPGGMAGVAGEDLVGRRHGGQALRPGCGGVGGTRWSKKPPSSS